MDGYQLICGNRLDEMRKMPDASVNLIYAKPRPPILDEQGIPVGAMDEWLGALTDVMLESHRLLKDTGSIYLHCDWRVSHHIRLMMDDVFGEANCRNEIAREDYTRQASSRHRFSDMRDCILFYSKGKGATANTFNASNYAWYDLGDVWEGLGDSVKLLERIVGISSNAGDVVLDPFCEDDGATLIAAVGLNRRAIVIGDDDFTIQSAECRLKEQATNLEARCA